MSGRQTSLQMGPGYHWTRRSIIIQLPASTMQFLDITRLNLSAFGDCVLLQVEWARLLGKVDEVRIPVWHPDQLAFARFSDAVLFVHDLDREQSTEVTRLPKRAEKVEGLPG
ncbi:hypothetical protein WJX73_005067 [Symbiochloris irregularis]|uniref:Uncharacterized protein n=1 Tax=Symbiochloris irregularis TaxID=706552 RepID=A0AAW1PVT9_9CHLO